MTASGEEARRPHQVGYLAVLEMMASDAFAEARLGRTKAVGRVDDDKRSNKETAVPGICAAGGLGAAAVMEAV